MKTIGQLQELLSVAEKARELMPGRWQQNFSTLHGHGVWAAHGSNGSMMVATMGHADTFDAANAAHAAAFDPTTCAELVRRLMSVEAEVMRLRRGEFTPQEFQDLCHNKSVQDGFEAFADGCETYQEKLFGRCRTKGQAT